MDVIILLVLIYYAKTPKIYSGVIICYATIPTAIQLNNRWSYGMDE